jgi:hypothetical protein
VEDALSPARPGTTVRVVNAWSRPSPFPQALARAKGRRRRRRRRNRRTSADYAGWPVKDEGKGAGGGDGGGGNSKELCEDSNKR